MNATSKQYTIEAIWAGERYITVGSWFSTDGDNWTTRSGEPVTERDFDRYSIRLVGGPRDGETVG